MTFIVETGSHHPGIKLYVTEARGTGRRKAFSLEGRLADVFAFQTRADTQNAVLQFSSMYGLMVVELKS